MSAAHNCVAAQRAALCTLPLKLQYHKQALLANIHDCISLNLAEYPADPRRPSMRHPVSAIIFGTHLQMQSAMQQQIHTTFDP